MGFNDRARKIEPQSRAFRMLDSFGRAVEPVKDMGEVFGFNAGAFVRYTNDNLLRAYLSADLDLALWRILERIRN